MIRINTSFIALCIIRESTFWWRGANMQLVLMTDYAAAVLASISGSSKASHEHLGWHPDKVIEGWTEIGDNFAAPVEVRFD